MYSKTYGVEKINSLGGYDNNTHIKRYDHFIELSYLRFDVSTAVR